MTTSENETVPHLEGYTVVHDWLASFAEESPSPRLAAVMLLNAAGAVALGAFGEAETERLLRDMIDRIPGELARSRDRLV